MSKMQDLTECLKGTPYEFMYSSHPTPTSAKYVFQHTVATSMLEARAVVAEAVAKIRAGTAHWSDGSPYTSGFYPDNMKDVR